MEVRKNLNPFAYHKEIEDTFKKLQEIKNDLERGQKKLAIILSKATGSEPKMYYSPENFKKKLNEKLKEGFNKPESNDSLSEIEKEAMELFKNECDKIDTTILKIKAQKEKDESAVRQRKEIIDKELDERLISKKKQLIESVQKAAEEYRSYLFSHGEAYWQARFKLFTEMYCSVAQIKSSEPPYELKKFNAELFVGISLSDLEKMVNIIITNAKNDKNAIFYLRDNLHKLCTEPDNVEFFKIEDEGIVTSQLKKIIIKETDKEFVKKNIKLRMDDLNKYEKELQDKLQEEAIKELKIHKELASRTIRKSITNGKLILAYTNSAKMDLESHAEFFYENIKTDCENMRSFMDEVNKDYIKIHAIISNIFKKVKDAIQLMIHSNDWGQKDIEDKVELTHVEDAIKKLNINILKLNQSKISIENDLYKARELYNGTRYPVAESFFKSIRRDYEEINQKKAGLLKELEEGDELLNTLTDYREIEKDCVFIKDQTDKINQLNDKIALELEKIEEDYFDKIINLAKMGAISSSFSLLMKEQIGKIKEEMNLRLEELKKIEQNKIDTNEKLVKAENRYKNHELQKRAKNYFNRVLDQHAIVFAKYKALDEKITFYPARIQAQKKAAIAIDKKNKIASELTKIVLDAIFDNPDLWAVRWGRGVHYHYNGQDYRFPHGIVQMIDQVATSANLVQCVENIKKTACERDRLSKSFIYRLFAPRVEATSLFYKIISKHLVLAKSSPEALRSALSQLPGIKLDAMLPPVMDLPSPTLTPMVVRKD